MTLTDQGLMAILGILCIVIFGAYTYAHMISDSVQQVKDQLADFKALHQAAHYEQQIKLIPIEEAFHAMRKVQESRLMESFLEDK